MTVIGRAEIITGTRPEKVTSSAAGQLYGNLIEFQSGMEIYDSTAIWTAQLSGTAQAPSNPGEKL